MIVAVLLLAMAAGVLAWAWTPDRSVDSLRARWAPAPSRFLSLDGMEVHLRDEGPADDPVPLVLVHGTASSLHTWEGWVDRLKARRRIVSFDRPGFGLTGPHPTGDYSMAGSAAFIGRLLDRLGIGRAVLVGNSSGGRVCCEAAALYPDRVAGLVLIGPAGYPRPIALPLGLRLVMSGLGPFLLHLLPRAAVAAGVRNTYGDPAKVTSEIIDRNYEVALRQGDRSALGATMRQSQGQDAARLIAAIRVPTLILWGTADRVLPGPPDAERFHAAIAGSRLVVLPGIGHVAQEEDPEATVAALERFLGGFDQKADPV